jgi:hypothetical protein
MIFSKIKIPYGSGMGRGGEKMERWFGGRGGKEVPAPHIPYISTNILSRFLLF